MTGKWHIWPFKSDQEGPGQDDVSPKEMIGAGMVLLIVVCLFIV